MKLFLILVATGCIVWLLNTLIALRGPREVQTYLALLGLAGLLAYFVVPRVTQTEHGYAVCYGLTMIPICLAASASAPRWLSDLGWERGLGAMAVSFAVSAYLAWLFGSEIPQPHSLGTKILLTTGFFFCALGFLSLVSAVPECAALQFRLRIVLGLFWLTSGAYSFCQVLGTLRAQALWQSISGYATQVMCIVFLGGLAWLLSGQQRELGRQEIRGQHVEMSALAQEAE